MSTGNRKRRKSNASRPELARTGQDPVHRGETRPSPLAPLPQWQWRTFPVYFAFALGSFIGVYLGLLAAGDNETISIAVFLVTASLLGWGFSRFAVRWMTTRRWVKPRVRRKS